jgi:cytochrome P450
VCKHCTHAGCLDVCRRVRLHRVWVLGWEPPISTVVRVAKRDCELGGIAIPEGTNVSVSVAAANRDPAHYPDPDWFDPTRKNVAHLMFGAGPHVCLGMQLARMETTVAINALLDRLPDCIWTRPRLSR